MACPCPLSPRIHPAGTEQVDGLEQAGEGFAFVGVYFGAPDFKEEDDAGFGAFVPGFMFDAVVEDQHFATLPRPRLRADAQGAAFRCE